MLGSISQEGIWVPGCCWGRGDPHQPPSVGEAVEGGGSGGMCLGWGVGCVGVLRCQGARGATTCTQLEWPWRNGWSWDGNGNKDGDTEGDRAKDRDRDEDDDGDRDRERDRDDGAEAGNGGRDWHYEEDGDKKWDGDRERDGDRDGDRDNGEMEKVVEVMGTRSGMGTAVGTVPVPVPAAVMPVGQGC